MANNFKGTLAGETKNQKKGEFYNFGLPAVGTCTNAPGACRNLVHTNSKNKKEPVCFAIRPVTNWPFTQKVAQMNGSNCIFKQYANLYLTFDKKKRAFMNYLKDILCPEIKKSFEKYYDQGINAFNPAGNLYKSYDCKNIWNMLSVYYNSSSQNDFLGNITPTQIKGKGIFVSYMINEINSIINKKHRGNTNLDIYIRIHYSGDFYSEDYFKKWVDITDYFSQNKRIHFMAYTKEIENIEKWLKNMGKNLQGGSNGINIKLVFSEMAGFGPCNNTSLTAMATYNRLNKFQPCMKYTAVKKIPQGYSGQVCNLICGNGCMRCYDEKLTNDVLVKIF